MSYKEWTLIHLSFFLTFLIFGLVVNVIQIILFFTVPRKLFRRINYYLLWTTYSQFLFLADWWSNSVIRVHSSSANCDELLNKLGHENALVLLNHHYETDWLFGWMIADRFQVLGNARVFLKRVLKYVPILGWSWSMSEFVFVDRNWNTDQYTVPKALKALEENYESPFWLLIFPEGTRFTQQKYEACLEFAQTKPGLPSLRHHLIPRTKGFVLTIQNLDPAKVPAIYDATLVASSNATISNMLLGRSVSGDLFLRRIATSDLKGNDEFIANRLMELFKEKDELKDTFLRTGSFGEDIVPLKISSKRIHSLVTVVILNILISFPIAIGALATMLYGSNGQIAILLVIVLILYFSLRKMIEVTKVNNSSDYGQNHTRINQ